MLFRFRTLQVLRCLREELVAAGRSAPTDEEIQAASQAGTLDTPETRALLSRMQQESDAAGLAFPPSLRE